MGRNMLVAACVVALAAGIACSGSGSDEAAPDGDGRPAGYQRPACERPEAEEPAAAEVAGAPADRDVTSFDGTSIRAHWFPVEGATGDDPAPTVLMGPGWGLSGDTRVGAPGLFGGLSISQLHESGFNVLTWDPRGFGESGGTSQVNSPDHEGRDVGVLLDWVAAQPEVQLDGPGDPRSGMVGASYGGGIQLTTAAVDCRVDALVPFIAWHSLETSLYKAGTPKIGWANLLTSASSAGRVDPHVTEAAASMNETGTVGDADVAWFIDRGPGELVEDVTVPTLLVQGTVDTLFTLDEAVGNYRALRDNGVPVAMLWFCGGHGTCLTNVDDTERVEAAAMAWLDRYVNGDESVELGPRFEFVDQDGATYAAEDYPVPAGRPVTARGSGELALEAEGGSGPATEAGTAAADALRGVSLSVTPSRAANAVDVPVPSPDEPALLVGAPELRLTYRGTAGAGERPTRVFAQLVDDETGLALGNQVTPIEVTLDGEEHTADVPLEVIAHAVGPSSRLTLQLVATTVAYAPPQLGGTVTFDSIDLSLPVAADIAPATPAPAGAG